MEAVSGQTLEDRIRASVQRGDVNGAVTLALRGYGEEIYSFIVASHGDSAEADEVFSIFAEALCRSLASFEWQSTLRTWAYSVVRLTSLRYRRDMGRRARREAPLPTDPDVLRTVAEVRAETEKHLKSEVRTKLAALRDSLPPEDRDLLILRVDRNLSWLELAVVLHTPDAATEGDGTEGADSQFASGGLPHPSLTGDALKREAARLRKRFQLVKERLRDMARKSGLLDEQS